MTHFEKLSFCSRGNIQVKSQRVLSIDLGKTSPKDMINRVIKSAVFIAYAYKRSTCKASCVLLFKLSLTVQGAN